MWKEKESYPESEIIEADTAAPRIGILARTFAAFTHRDYSYLWFGSLLSNIGTWMQITAILWVVNLLTRSPFYVGLAQFFNMIPIFFFVLYAGSVADRVDRRRLLIFIQYLLIVFALALGILSTLNRLTLIWVYSLTLATGLGTAFMFPAYQALIPEVVPPKDLLNGIALNSAQFNGARFVGPVIAGALLASRTFGVPANFYVNALSFIAVIIALMLIHPNEEKKAPALDGTWKHFTEGIKYAMEYRYVRTLLLYVGILSVFGLSFMVLVPAYITDILKGGGPAYGVMLGASGLGTLVGALTVANLAHVAAKEKIVKYTVVLFSAFLIVFALSRIYLLSLLAIAAIGWAFISSISTLNTMVQEAVPGQIRGRIMGIYVWMFLGPQPFGALLFGSVAHFSSPPVPLIMGAIVLTLAASVVFIRPKTLQPNGHPVYLGQNSS